jgi:hypothetical protein
MAEFQNEKGQIVTGCGPTSRRRIYLSHECCQPTDGFMESANPYASPQGGPLFHEPRPIRVPVTIADILRVATSLYFGNFPLIASITLLFWIPLELLQAYLDFFVLDPQNFAGSFQFQLLIQNVIGIIPEAGIMVVGAAALRGEEPTFPRTMTQAFESWPRMFVTRLTVSIAILLALVLFIVPGVYVAVRAAFAEQAAVIEHQGGMSAPGRSFALTRDSFWRTFGVLSIMGCYLVGAGILVNSFLAVLDHWLFSAALSLLVDLVAPWAVLLLVAAYWSRAHADTAVDVGSEGVSTF